MALRVNSGVQLDSVGRKLITFLERVLPAALQSRMYVTSNFRPGDPGYHGDTGSNGAIDFAAPMTEQGAIDRRDAAKIVYDDYSRYFLEIIHTTPFNTDNGFYVKNGARVGPGFYGSVTEQQHIDHIHLAISEASADALLAATAHLGQPDPVEPPAGHTECFGWDASNHDWGRGPMDLAAAKADGIAFFTHKCAEGVNGWYVDPYYKRALDRAKAAGIPVLGAYFVLHPGNPELQADQFFEKVNNETPYWRDVPWIWQLDAEKFDYMDRAPNLDECNRFLDRLHFRSGGRGYFVAYAPKWLYGDSLTGIKYDLWASDYTGSGSPRPYREQWASVLHSSNPLFSAYSGKTPLILQFSSDATIGTQPTCDINKFRGTTAELIALAGGGTTGTPTPNPGGTVSVLDETLGQGPADSDIPTQMARTALAWTWKGVIDANTKLDNLSITLSEADRDAIVSALTAAMQSVVVDAVKTALREGTA